MGGKIAVLTLLEGANSDVAKDVAMQAAAMRPEYLKEEDIDAERISIAYEPVWAIGTGRVAGPEEIIEAHKVVRTFLEQKFAAQGCNIRILYGGSVKPENAKHIISLKNVNGVLVGGASLVATSFSQIVLA